MDMVIATLQESPLSASSAAQCAAAFIKNHAPKYKVNSGPGGGGVGDLGAGGVRVLILEIWGVLVLEV